jgi:hypothetical protein
MYSFCVAYHPTFSRNNHPFNWHAPSDFGLAQQNNEKLYCFCMDVWLKSVEIISLPKGIYNKKVIIWKLR